LQDVLRYPLLVWRILVSGRKMKKVTRKKAVDVTIPLDALVTIPPKPKRSYKGKDKPIHRVPFPVSIEEGIDDGRTLA
jgi:hypothetical protein